MTLPRALLLILAFLVPALALAAPAAADQCYADYKAKKDAPLRLQYGVMELQGPCRRGPAQEEVARRLAAHGWILLNVVSIFGPEGLDQRKADAGNFFLRF